MLLIAVFSCGPEECEKHSASVHIEETEEGYRLIRNGEPYFINGAAAEKTYLKELKEAGANTARIYDTINLKRTLDQAQALDLAIVADIPMPKFNNASKYYTNDSLFNLVKTNVKRVVSQHKNHPALLYWNLGNELYYPYFHQNTEPISRFNELIDLIHEIDPNHPVSTTTIGANKLRVLSIESMSPQLDFISFNSFGVLSTFSSRLKPIAPIWDGPHVITEWGVNGGWEAELTTWDAPIEETSTKKAEQVRERYYSYLEPIKNTGSLGSFIFYWGRKNEFTPSWYSLFGPNRLKTEAVFEMEKIWKNSDKSYPGPQLNYIYLNRKGARDNIVLSPKDKANAEVFFDKAPSKDLIIHWEIREESWYNFSKSIVTEDVKFSKNGHKVNFQAPSREGPYRLYVYLTNSTEYYATANIPFFVLSTTDEE
ncbi:hypothetical protein E0K83_13165 [Gramella sp. BOM4]|nr:hypothetical protein [Christiangramia bathymodioli]